MITVCKCLQEKHRLNICKPNVYIYIHWYGNPILQSNKELKRGYGIGSGIHVPSVTTAYEPVPSVTTVYSMPAANSENLLTCWIHQRTKYNYRYSSQRRAHRYGNWRKVKRLHQNWHTTASTMFFCYYYHVLHSMATGTTSYYNYVQLLLIGTVATTYNYCVLGVFSGGKGIRKHSMSVWLDTTIFVGRKYFFFSLSLFFFSFPPSITFCALVNHIHHGFCLFVVFSHGHDLVFTADLTEFSPVTLTSYTEFLFLCHYRPLCKSFRITSRKQRV